MTNIRYVKDKVTLDFSVNFKISNTSKIDTDFWLLGFFIIISLRISDKKLILTLFSTLKTQTLQTQNHHCVKCEPKILKNPLSQFSPLLQAAWRSSLSLLLIKRQSEEGVGIKLSRGKLTGGLTPVTAAIKHQINRHKPSSPPHLAAPTNTKSGQPGWGQKTNHLSWCLYLAPNYRHFHIFKMLYTREKLVLRCRGHFSLLTLCWLIFP